MHEPVIGQIHLFFCLRLNSSLSSLRTCSINRCEPVALIVANPVTPERSSPTVIMDLLPDSVRARATIHDGII